MQRSIKKLLGFRLEATDGEIGKVKDFYFDDKKWAVRYLIVKTGNWLSGREVLISPVAIAKVSYDTETFPVNLTKDQVSSSPDIDTDKPVSRQHELDLYKHYAWQEYGSGGFYAGGIWNIAYPMVYDTGDEPMANADSGDKHVDDDPHLISTQATAGYHVHATDGEIGHVNDFIIDDKSWQLIYFVVDTHNWFGGKKVLIPVSNVKDVQWDNAAITLDMSMDTVKDSKEFDEPEFIFPVNILEL